jgi:hypothetical protein
MLNRKVGSMWNVGLKLADPCGLDGTWEDLGNETQAAAIETGAGAWLLGQQVASSVSVRSNTD